MPQSFDQPGEDALDSLSLAELAEIAIQDELVDGLDIGEDHVTIHQGERRVRLPKHQAPTFLIDMLRGRSWFIEEPRPQRAESRAEELEANMEASAQESSTAPSEHTLESTLSGLLSFAEQDGIITGFRMDLRTRTVRIDIPACSTELPFVDALAYLIDCLQDELRMLRREKRRHRP